MPLALRPRTLGRSRSANPLRGLMVGLPSWPTWFGPAHPVPEPGGLSPLRSNVRYCALSCRQERARDDEEWSERCLHGYLAEGTQ